MRTDPVAEISGRFSDDASASPTSAPPMTTHDTPAGTSGMSFITSATMFWHAMAVSGVFSLGFQTTGSPQTHASIAFHAHTATGKLNAVITPIGPSGCHCSIIRWPGRSEAIVRP